MIFAEQGENSDYMWNFISGYVKISILGQYPERLVNRALNAGIPIKDAERKSGACFVCRIPMRRFKSLRVCARGSGCRVHILKKGGLPLLMIKARREPALCLCALLMAAVMAAASSRIWFFEIESRDYPRASAESTLASFGFGPGVKASEARPADIEAALRRLPGVLTAKAVRRGVCVKVSVTGKGGSAQDDPGQASEGASGIYADRDCVIDSISVTSGRAVVSPGEAVAAGQLLISGDMTALKPGYYVPAEGEVYGRLLYRASASVGRYGTELKRTGSYARAYEFRALGRSLLPGVPYAEYETERECSAVINACPLPLTVWACRCYELRQSQVDLGDRAAGDRAAVLAQEKLFDSITKGARILSVHTEFSVSQDGGVTATLTATTLERIGTGKGQ